VTPALPGSVGLSIDWQTLFYSILFAAGIAIGTEIAALIHGLARRVWQKWRHGS